MLAALARPGASLGEAVGSIAPHAFSTLWRTAGAGQGRGAPLMPVSPF